MRKEKGDRWPPLIGSGGISRTSHEAYLASNLYSGHPLPDAAQEGLVLASTTEHRSLIPPAVHLATAATFHLVEFACR